MTVSVGGQSTEELLATLKKLGSLLLEHAGTRFDLVRVELAEERGRLGRVVVRGAILCFLAFLTVELIMLTVAGLYWDGPYRMAVVGSMFVVSLLATLATYASLRNRRFRHAQRLAAVAAELKQAVTLGDDNTMVPPKV